MRAAGGHYEIVTICRSSRTGTRLPRPYGWTFPFLHGTVESIDAVVTTVAGTYTNAVKTSYIIDYGAPQIIGEHGILIGTSAAETRGHVHDVPDVPQTIALSLTENPTAVEAATWGATKALYR